MITEAGAIFRIEFPERLKRRPSPLLSGHRDRRAATRTPTGGGNDLMVADRFEQRITHRRAVGVAGAAVFDFDDAGETFGHHRHVRGDDGVTEPAEFLYILFVDDLVELLLVDPE